MEGLTRTVDHMICSLPVWLELVDYNLVLYSANYTLLISGIHGNALSFDRRQISLNIQTLIQKHHLNLESER